MTPARRKVVPNEAVISTQLDDEAVLLNTHTGLYFGLDAVGARIWELLTGGATQEQIADQIALEYEAPEDQIARDVADFLQVLRERGLTVEVDDAASAGTSPGQLQ